MTGRRNIAVGLSEVLLLSGSAIEACRYAVVTTQKHRRRHGLPPSTELQLILQAISSVSDIGQSDTENTHGEDSEVMTIRELAELLNQSERTARRRARQLGGHKSGGIWFVDRQAAIEHLEGKTA